MFYIGIPYLYMSQQSLNKTLQIKDIVKFILENRKNKAFRDWSKEAIAVEFSKAFDKKSAVYSLNPAGKINGVVIGEASYEYKVFHVRDILTTEEGVLKKLIKKFLELYPGWDIQAYRHDKLTRYFNTPLLIKKIYTLT